MLTSPGGGGGGGEGGGGGGGEEEEEKYVNFWMPVTPTPPATSVTSDFGRGVNGIFAW
jgi:hypothetical protein